MDTMYLHSDESIILAMQDIVANGVRIEVILTSIRLMLVESEKERVLYEDIPLETLGSVVAGENARFEPTITLFLKSPAGEPRAVELIFFQRPGIIKTGERDQLAAKLKERLSPSRVQVRKDALAPFVQGAGVQPGTPPPEAGPALMPEIPAAAQMPLKERTPPGSSRPHTPSLAEALLDRIPLIAIPALLVIVVAVVGGAFTYVQIQHELSAGLTAPVPTITPQAIATPALAIRQTPAMQVISPAASPPAVIIPRSGVWVRVQYNRTFIGSVGAKGVLKQVNATGDKFYQIAARDDIIDVSIAKQDGSTDLLAVEVYRDGTLVQRSKTSTPAGIVDLHVNLKS
ncbi:MAG: hypothetical protein NTY71_06485 [Methanoregula sp.]|nr:hypothetical protein [Methanoregula sp.]